MIKLTYVGDYKSIEYFDPVLLPDLTVLTGRNGSGKSQLFEAIIANLVSAEDIAHDQIGYITQKEFVLMDSAVQSSTTYHSLIEQFWNYGTSNYTNAVNAQPGLQQLNHEEKRRIQQLASSLSSPLYLLRQEDFDKQKIGALFLRFDTYRNWLRNYIHQNSQQHTNMTDFFKELLDNGDIFIEDISKADISRRILSDNYQGGVLPQQLSMTIYNYASLLRNNEINDVLNKTQKKKLPVMSSVEFVAEYGPKPWKLINDVLRGLDGFKFKLDFDEKSFDPNQHSVSLKFIEKGKRNGLTVGVNDLSSGEKTLIALVVSLYTSNANQNFPKLLLLDEIDGSLHPSMTVKFIELINTYLVQQNHVKVVLVTHSPSTVAMSPEESIFVMDPKGGREGRIVPETKARALSTLTEGFIGITTDASKTVLEYQVSGSLKDLVYVEGPTDVKYLKEAAKRKNNKIFETCALYAASGYGTLDNLWKLLGSLPDPKSITHGKKALLVYDCDQVRPLEIKSGHIKFTIDFVPKNPIGKGIENLFPASLIDRAKIANPSWFYCADAQSQIVTVDDAYKNDLCDWIIKNATEDEFEDLYKLLGAVVSKLS